MREQAAPLAAAALRDRLTHRAYLAELLGAELDDRNARRRERRIAEARFPRLKRLADFELAAAPACFYLLTNSRSLPPAATRALHLTLAANLRAAGRKARMHRPVIDQAAAVVILQEWLDAHAASVAD